MKREISFIPSKAGTAESTKTKKNKLKKEKLITELENAKEVKPKNSVTEHLADEATKNGIDSTLGTKKDVQNVIHDRIQKEAEEITKLTEKLKRGIPKEEAEENRKAIEEQWEREKEEKVIKAGGNIDIFREQKNITTKDVEKQAEDLNDEDIRKKQKNRQGWLKKHAWGYLASTVIGLVAGNHAKANEAPKTQDPEDLKHKIEASISQEKKISEDAYVVTDKDLEGGGDGDKEHQKIQDEEDSKIYEKHEKEWEKNHKYYVRDGEELKSVVRHSLSHLRESFEDPRDLRNSVNELYDKVLTPKEILDLHSFIVNGTPDGDNDALSRKDIEYLQTIYNKIASSPSDTANDSLPETLSSNSANKETGIDSMYGLATGKASHDLLLNKVGEILKLSGLTPEIKHEISNDVVSKEFEPLPAERGYTTITFENGFNFTPEHQRSLELFNEKVDGFGNFDNLSDFMSKFKTSDFDKIQITGEDIGNGVKYNGETFDFDKLDDLGTGKGYVVTAGNYELHFDYLRGEGGINKTFSNLEFTYSGEKGDIKISADEISKDLSNFDKNDPNSQGFTRDIKGLKIDAFGEIKLGLDVHKYENANEVGGSLEKINLEVNGFKITSDGFSGKYKTPTGEFDFNKMFDGAIHGGKIGDLMERLELRGGSTVIEKGDMKLEYNDNTNKYFFHDHGKAYEISVDHGNFKLLNEKGEGAIYHGGIGTYAKINGEEIASKDFFDNLFNQGADKLYSNSAEVGISIGGGFIELSTGETTNSIDQEIADKIGVDIDQTFQRIADRAEELKSSSNVKDILSKGADFKNFALDEMKGLMERTKESGNIDMSNWSASVNFKTLADNFELVGKHDVASVLRETDILFSALGNDLGNITINQAFLDGYNQAENKGDFVSNHIWGKSTDELTKDFTGRALDKFGAEFLSLSKGEVESVINAALNGSVEGLIVSPEKVSAFWAFNKELNAESNIIVHGSANLGEQNHEAYVNILDTQGKEHFDVGAKYGYYGNLGVSGLLNLYHNHPFYGDAKTSVNLFGDLGFNFVKINDLNFGFNDGNGNHYKIADINGFVNDLIENKTKDVAHFIGKRMAEGKIMPMPQVEIGANINQTFGTEGEKLQMNLNTSFATNIAYGSLDVSFATEKQLDNLLHMPVTVGGKIDANDITHAGRYGVSGQVYVRVGLDGILRTHKH